MATVEQRGNSYRITVYGGYGVDGKQKRYRETWTPPEGAGKREIEKALNKKISEFEDRIKGNRPIISATTKFQIVANEWLGHLEEIGKVKARTLQRYKSYAARTYESIGHMQMKKIGADDVQRFISSLSKAGVKQLKKNETTPSGLSPKTVRGYLGFVSGVFTYAISRGMPVVNPCVDRAIELPTLKEPEHKYYTKDEVIQLVKLLKDEPMQYRVFFNLAVMTGMRRAELLGLEWHDINFSNGIIRIERTSLYNKEKGIFTDTPKTKGSRRTVNIDSTLVKLLEGYKAEQDKLRQDLGELWENNDRLFTQWNGSPMHPNTPATWFAKFCKRTGMRYINVHGLRHTNASLRINDGADIATISASLGHSNITTTLNVYTHEYEEIKAKSAANLGNMIYSEIDP